MLAHAYEYVAAIAKYGSISKAASALYITQPALSRYLSRLEDDLGVVLFDRTANPIKLTPAGRKFHEKALNILSIQNSLLEDLEQITATPSGNLRIGTSSEFGSMVLPYFYPEFCRLYPNVHLEIVEGRDQFLLNELELGHIDLVWTASSNLSDAVAFEPFTIDPVILAVPVSNPLVQNYDLTTNSPFTPFYLKPELICDADFIVCAQELGIGQLAQEMFQKYQLTPNIVLEIRKHETALRIASAGLGMVFTPVRTPLRISLLKPLAYFSIENPIHTRIRKICYLKSAPLSLAARCSIQCLNHQIQQVPELLPPSCQLVFQPGNI